MILKFGLPHITKPDLDIGFNMDRFGPVPEANPATRNPKPRG
jgi:hypothetical protein